MPTIYPYNVAIILPIIQNLRFTMQNAEAMLEYFNNISEIIKTILLHLYFTSCGLHCKISYKDYM